MEGLESRVWGCNGSSERDLMRMVVLRSFGSDRQENRNTPAPGGGQIVAHVIGQRFRRDASVPVSFNKLLILHFSTSLQLTLSVQLGGSS
jgi:hypothetical protein